jgi:hypothetical protein
MFQRPQANAFQGATGPGADGLATPGRRTLTDQLAPVQLAPVQRKARSEPPSDAAGEPRLPRLDLVQRQAQGAPPSGGGVAAAVAGERHDQALPSDGGGHPMPQDVRAKMESAFGADFSAVRIHEGSRAQALGARAYAQGTDIHFAPGAYQPNSTGGQELLGHELAHVVQQSQGRVQATTQAKGVGVNDDSSLEREADEMGARAARCEPAGGAPPAHPPQDSAPRGRPAAIDAAQGAPVQRVRIGPDDIETTDPQNRQRVLNYLRNAGPYELENILERMEKEALLGSGWVPDETKSGRF